MLPTLGGCKARNAYHAPPPPDVDVAHPIKHDVPTYLYATGQMAAVRSVDLVARVQGFLEAINYRDGEFVHKGDLLFLIEPAPYAAQAQQARANLASTQAKAEFGAKQFDRYQALARLDSGSLQQAQQTRSDRDSADASVLQAQAALLQADITYGYTHVTAPFDGFVSAHQASVGQLVGSGQATELAQIAALDPIWVNFNVPEQDGAEFLRRQNPLWSLQVERSDESGYPHGGHVDYIAPTVDPATGTLALRGVLENGDLMLRPGNFVRVRVRTGVEKDALLVPAECVGNDQGGRTVFVLTADNKVGLRPVTIGPLFGRLQVIEHGLAVGDRVIVNDAGSVRPDEAVSPHDVAVTP
ncbi:efflux RND transporter periplasmic adaptor subunit [Acidomonas methanolica]|uniref:efflux RND transporter periplasmic adaptor subunit n=1 Tax=Acidomonas methanolica TaxID=437 RepID=UPI002119CBF9|nr:efflux RND transporter periplasmic adaptor subunit [Acidomonas methanolica]